MTSNQPLKLPWKGSAAGVALALCLTGILAPQVASGQVAQVAEIEQALEKLRPRLDVKIFNGETLNVKTWEELMTLEQFARVYQRHLKTALRAWKRLRQGRSKALFQRVKEAQDYWRALYPLYVAKTKTILRPQRQAAPPAQKPTFKKATFEEVLTGPAATTTKPALIHAFGGQETLVEVLGSPGSANKASMWSVRAAFAVKYKGAMASDHVSAQVYRGRQKVGAPMICKPFIVKPWPVAAFDCRSEHRDRAKMFKSRGAHSLRLSYHNLVLGKKFKNFAEIPFTPLQLWGGSKNRPAVRWRTDHDQHMGPTTIEEYNGNTGATLARRAFIRQLQSSISSAVDSKSSRQLILRTWVKRTQPFRTQATCLYKGKPVGWGPSSHPMRA